MHPQYPQAAPLSPLGWHAGSEGADPVLLRAGGVGTHHQLFASWFDAVDKRVEDLTAKRAAKAEYDRERNARLKAERQAQSA